MTAVCIIVALLILVSLAVIIMAARISGIIAAGEELGAMLERGEDG